MKKLLINLPENFASALGWTLLYSLVQMFAILLIISVLSYFYRKNSVLKYALNIGALALQLVISILTFWYIYVPTHTQNLTEISSNDFVENQLQTGYFAQIQPHENSLTWLEQIQFFINSNLNFFVDVWFLGIFFLIIRLVGGYFYTQNLKSKRIQIVNDDVQKIFENLLNKVNNNKKIQLLESHLAKVPMTIGHFEQVILLPFGLATGLSIKELEAILAHELAHIQRNDYLVNLLQSIVEILFFFNPSVWFIASKIRDERENCCDDLAIELIGDKVSLAKAITAVEAFRQHSNIQPNSLAMAFGGNRQTLMSRIKRIIGISDSKSMSYEGVFGTIFLVFASIIYFNLGKVEAQTTLPKPPKTAPKPPKNPKIISNWLADGTNYFSNGLHEISTKNGQVILDGKRIKLPDGDSAKIAFHQAEMQRIEKELSPIQGQMQKIGAEMQDYGKLIQEKTQPLHFNNKKIAETVQKIEDIAKKQAETNRKIANLDENSSHRRKLEKQLAEYDSQMDKLNDEMDSINEQIELTEIEKYSVPIDSLGKIMDSYSQKMDDLSEELTKHLEEIDNLMPMEAKKIMRNPNTGEMGKWKSNKSRVVTPPTPPLPPLSPFEHKKNKMPVGGTNLYKNDLTGNFIHLQNGMLNVNGEIYKTSPQESQQLRKIDSEIAHLEQLLKQKQISNKQYFEALDNYFKEAEKLIPLKVLNIRDKFIEEDNKRKSTVNGGQIMLPKVNSAPNSSKNAYYEVYKIKIAGFSLFPKQLFVVKNKEGQVYRLSWDEGSEQVEKMYNNFVERIETNLEIPSAKFSTEIEAETYMKSMRKNKAFTQISDVQSVQNSENSVNHLKSEINKLSAEIRNKQKIDKKTAKHYSMSMDSLSNLIKKQYNFVEQLEEKELKKSK